VLRLNPNGSITVLAGNGLRGYSGDGDLAINASLRSPQSAAFDGKGNLYIADTDNNRIRMVTPDGMITTVAGNGAAGFSGHRAGDGFLYIWIKRGRGRWARLALNSSGHYASIGQM
jgi:sugar lactone lactonase YvrE